MATRNLKATSDLASDFTRKLADACDGPDGAPYLDGRFTAAILSQSTQRVYGTIVPGTTLDKNGNVIADADDIVVECGFTPFIIGAYDGTAGALYLNFLGMPAAATLKIIQGANPSLVTGLTFGSGADVQKFTIQALVTTTTNPLMFFALG